MLSKIQNWTAKFLSYAGRLQLIKSVLFGIQSYWASVFTFPAKIIKAITSLLTRFLWKGTSLQTHGTKVAWKKVSVPYSEGGLNIKNLKDWNRASILLHLWEVINPNSTSLWAKWIRNTVLKDRSFWVVPIPNDCSWIWRKVLQLRDLASLHVLYRVGNGKTFNLWFDPWYKSKPLASSPLDPLVLNSGLGPTTKVEAFLPSAVNGWLLPPSNHHSVRQFRLGFDYSTPYDLNAQDSVVWQSAAQNLAHPITTSAIWDSIRMRGTITTWTTTLWHKLHVPRYSFITWLLLHNGIKTKDRLIQYGIAVDPICVLCHRCWETVMHLFFSCPFSYAIMFPVMRKVGWRGSSRNWDDILHALLVNPGPNRPKMMASLALTAVIYFIWKERNARLHSHIITPASCIIRELLHILRAKMLCYFKPRPNDIS